MCVTRNFSIMEFGAIESPRSHWNARAERYALSGSLADVMRVAGMRRRLFSLYQTNALGFQSASEDDPASPSVRLASRLGFFTSLTLYRSTLSQPFCVPP
jgi:hypothetical protein